MPEAAILNSGSHSLWPRRETLETALPFLALLVMLGIIFAVRPTVFSYFGLTLLFKLAIPLMFAALSQMLIINLGEIDLSNGAFVGLVTCIVAVYLEKAPGHAVLLLVGTVLVYVAVGWLISVRKLPSIVVTLGMSFVWLGCAIIILPAPGGHSPAWLIDAMRWKPPLMPLPLWTALGIAVIGHWALKSSSYGIVLRGAGANPKSVARAGWSLVKARLLLYAGAALLAVIAGLFLSGITTSGDPNVAPGYTMLGVGAVILGGGTFNGGVVSPIGTVVGALTLSLASSVLSFLQVAPVWQIGAQGLILFLVLAGRVLIGGRRL
ncbi:MAG: ABC transporter permease [Azospirillaceae bacterium]|nr:ABC transporter permease [Azospirillaceae bacterium]